MFPAQRQEVGHAVVETEAKLRAEVNWVYHLAHDSRWAEHCNLPLAPVSTACSQLLSTLIKNILGGILQ